MCVLTQPLWLLRLSLNYSGQKEGDPGEETVTGICMRNGRCLGQGSGSEVEDPAHVYQ